LSVDPVADRAAVSRKGAVEASGGDAVSRNAREPVIGLVTVVSHQVCNLFSDVGLKAPLLPEAP